MRWFLRALLGACVACCQSTLAAVNEQEKSLQSLVAGYYDQDLALLERSVNINSGTLNFEGVREVGDLFAKEFRSLGFTTQWIEGRRFNRAGHLVARRGERGPRFLLIGHLDTVFAADSPFQRFELVDESHARGPGVTDMKGGNVVMLSALRALRDAELLDAVQVTVVLTGDEERRGRPLDIANRALIQAADWADIALGFEDGDGDPATAVVARRSSSSWLLEVVGKPAHSSQIFRDDIGYGAIFELARILDDWRAALADEPNLTFNPGLVVGGTQFALNMTDAQGSAAGKNNVIAQGARASGDIRALSPGQLHQAQARMRELVRASLPHTSARLTFNDSYPPMPPSEGNRRLLAMYDAVSRDLGYGPVTATAPKRAGAADISFTTGRVAMALDGLGLMGSGGHTDDEIADLATLTQQASRAAVLMYRLASDPALNSPE